MPALPFVTDVAKIQLHQTYGDDASIVNSFHCKFTGSATESLLNGWAVAITTAWKAHLQTWFVSDLVLNGVYITDLSSDLGATGSDIENNAGTNTATMGTPANTAMVMQFQINRRYRGGHPRQYICGIPPNNLQNEDHWLPASIDAWEAAYTLFMTAVVAGAESPLVGQNIVNVSYVDGHTWYQDARGNWHKQMTYRATPQVDVVNGYTVNPIVGTQRRRAR